MGYEVTVRGRIKFKDVNRFKEEFKKINKHRATQIGLHGDFDYFFTKMWGDNLEFLEIDEDGFVDIHREGKLWYDEDNLIEFLSKYACGTIECVAEDGAGWRYIINEDGSFKRQLRKNVWVD